MSYRQALEQTAIALGDGFAAGSAEETQAITRFTDFLREWNSETIADNVQAVYASEAYFNDTIEEMNSNKEIATILNKYGEGNSKVISDLIKSRKSFISKSFC